MPATKINAGKYRHKAELFEVPTSHEFAGKDDTPKLLHDLWVSITPKGGSEPVTGEQVNSITTYELRTPWKPYEINPSMRIVSGGKTYELASVINVGEQNEEYLMTATRLNDE